GRKIYSKRMSVVEPVFGNIRWAKGMHRFTLRTKRKVNVQWLFYCLIHQYGLIWIKSNSGITNWLTSVASGNGKVVAVGSGATIMVSADTGMTWMRQTIPVDSKQNFWCVEFGNGKFIAVGTSGLIYSSTDGFTWTQEISGITLWLTSLTYANGQFVASGVRGTILTSTDGKSWKTRNSDSTKAFWGIGCGQKQIVAVGSTKNGGLASISDDCISWKNEATVATMPLLGVTAGNGKFIAVGSKGTIATIQETSSLQWTKKRMLRAQQLRFVHNRITYSINNESTAKVSLFTLDGKAFLTRIVEGFGHIEIPMDLSNGYYIARLFMEPKSKLITSIPIVRK
ncbi:MAG: hypothetical protein GF401_03255, partial [Chitinivibrionales bacterium]|nr:hypothetical protein [Chitinivibrionales bacterium]